MRATMNANEAFENQFHGEPNFMTQHIVERGTAGEYHWELSNGLGFTETIWGVTVLTLDGERTDKGKMFHSRNKAQDYINEPNECSICGEALDVEEVGKCDDCRGVP